MNRRALIPIAGLIIVLLIITGCTSMVSHHIVPDGQGCHHDVKTLRGVPLTIKVPYQLQVTVTESNYFKPGEASKTGAKTMIPIKLEGELLFTRNIDIKVIDKDEVVMVDQVRPAAGKLEPLKASDSGEAGNIIENQFFKKMGGKITDNTIEEIDKGINRIFNAAAKTNVAMATSAPKNVTQDTAGITTVNSIVAIKVFDVHSPCLEDQVREFLLQHQCSVPPCERVHKNLHK